MRWLKVLLTILAGAAGVAVLLVGAGYLYVTQADLSTHKHRVERMVSNATGRELTIAGDFRPVIAGVSSLTFSDLTLSNVDWATRPVMLQVEEVHVSVKLSSLLSRPILVPELRITGARIWIERDAAGLSNWDFSPDKSRRGPAFISFDPRTMVFTEIEIERLSIEARGPRRAEPLDLELPRLSMKPRADGTLELQAHDGTVDDKPLQATGTFGPLNNLLDATDVSFDFALRIGEMGLDLAGHIPDLERLRGIDMRFAAEGPHFERIISLYDVHLFTEGPGSLEGTISPGGAGMALAAHGKLGEIEVSLEGSVDEFQNPRDGSFQVRLAGPDAERVGSAGGIAGLPAETFELAGRITTKGDVHTLHEVQLSVGAMQAHLSGELRSGGESIVTDLDIKASGPDLSALQSLLGIANLPAVRFESSGGISIDGKVMTYTNWRSRIGQSDFAFDGKLDTADPPAATDLKFSAQGPSLAAFNSLASRVSLPATRYAIAGRVRHTPDGPVLEDFEADVGDNHIALNGRLGPGFKPVRSDLTVTVSGPNLAEALKFASLPSMPAEAFEISSRITIGERIHRLSNTKARIGALSASGSGEVAARRGYEPASFQVELSAASLAKSAGMFGLRQGFPDEPFSATGTIALRSGVLSVANVEASIRDARLAGAGTLGTGPGMAGTDLRIDASGPVLSALSGLAGLPELPALPFSVSGELQRQASATGFQGASGNLGKVSATVDGVLGDGDAPTLTDLRFTASGESPQHLTLLAGLPTLPALPFDLTGNLRGMSADASDWQLQARLGDSDMTATLSIGHADRAQIDATLVSQHLDLTPWMGEDTDTPTADQAGFTISDTPFDTAWIDGHDAAIDLSAAQLTIGQQGISNVRSVLRISESRLSLDPFSLDGVQGSLSGALDVVRSADAPRVTARLNVKDLRPRFMAVEGGSPIDVPPVAAKLDITGDGNSLHAIMSSANGRLEVIQGAGVIPEGNAGLLFTDITMGLLRTINPFGDDAPKNIALECGAAMIDIENGVATARSLAVETKQLLLVGAGTVDFSTERVDLTLRLEPREGIGLSVAGLTNSEIKLHGTLTTPKVSVSNKGAGTQAGLAWATGGLSLIAKGLTSRLRAERDVCTAAIEAGRKESD